MHSNGFILLPNNIQKNFPVLTLEIFVYGTVFEKVACVHILGVEVKVHANNRR